MVATSTWALSVGFGLVHAMVTAVAVSHEHVTPVFGGTTRVETLLAAAVVAVSEALAVRAGNQATAPASRTTASDARWCRRR